MLIIGVISDTHGLLRPEAINALRDCDEILHTGDIGSAEVLKALEQIAPVHAIRGNVDTEPWAKAIPVTLTVQLDGRKFYLIHNRAELKKLPAGIDAVIFGHSHQPAIEQQGNVLYFNPGSAGPRRFNLPVSVGKIQVEDGKLSPSLIPLSIGL
ncbi:MAG TPA: metallophosphoesterase family protein [Terriglobales bacterium]|nr:metallophosphoesterase family protein [Terriglobales bacterium]